jgi:branched-chain amino acid transport system ATP-binding protein
MLALQDVSASYGELRVLNGVSLSVGEGERVAIFGHNGAGKTTLLKCAIGAHPEVSGRITFYGEDVTKGQVHANARRGIAFVPQGHNVFRELSVERNLAISGLLHDAGFVQEIYGMFPLLKERHRQIAGSLSGGQQQMLALGMALMTKPKILLLDEPATGLGPIIVQNVMVALKDVNERFGTALVIVEQNIPATVRIVDRAIVIKTGRIVSDGPAEALAKNTSLWELF